MASVLRLAMRRQSGQHSAACRVLTRPLSSKTVTSLKLSSLKVQQFHPNPSPPRTAIQKSTPTRILQIASFHTSGRREILPAGPQIIDGTANDAAQVPEPSPTHGSYHWAFERLVSVALIPLTIAPFAAGTLNPITDAILCATIIIHSHIGFQSIIIDYVPVRRLPKIRALFWWGLRAATLTVAFGLYEFETNDVGLTEAVKRVWTA